MSKELEPSLNEHEILYSSYLSKRNKSHNWQKKWFVLRPNQLAYYKDSKEYKASKVIPTHEILSITEIPDNHKFHFIIVTSLRIYHLRANDSKDYEYWIKLLKKIIDEDHTPFPKLMNSEKGKNILSQNILNVESTIGDNGFEFVKPRIQRDISLSSPETELELENELQNLHFFGTDDNFTSGPGSDTGGLQSINRSQTSLQNINISQTPQIPTPIQEADEFQKSDQDVIYYNSFSRENPEHIIDRGYLYRLKKRYNKWKKYYILLTNRYLYFFKSIKDYENNKICKSIDLDKIIDTVELDPLSRTKLHCMLIITPLKRIRFCAESEEDLTKWLVLLKTIIKIRREAVSSQQANI